MVKLGSLVCFVTTTCAAVTAQAVPYSPTGAVNFYVGGDYQYDRLSNSESDGISANNILETNLNGGDVHAGIRYNNLGLELGYEMTEEAEKSNILGTSVDSKIKQRGATLDVLGYLPVSSKVELIGTIGAADVTTEASLSTGESVDDSKFKMRGGVGAQYWATKNVNLRSIVRYEGEDFSSNNINNSMMISVGMNVQF